MADKLKIHFIGIGGSSMNGLAQIMKNKGHESGRIARQNIDV